MKNKDTNESVKRQWVRIGPYLSSLEEVMDEKSPLALRRTGEHISVSISHFSSEEDVEDES